jgi:hypothetical protein
MEAALIRLLDDTLGSNGMIHTLLANKLSATYGLLEPSERSHGLRGHIICWFCWILT